MTEPLWAKSGARPPTNSPPTIAEHCQDVLRAAETIWAVVGADLAGSASLSGEELSARLLPLLRAAAVLHDIGKANSAFQTMLRAGPRVRERQPIRHEILSAILLVRQLLLSGLDAAVLWPLVWALSGHHLKMRVGPGGEELYVTGNTPRLVTLHLKATQVGTLAEEAAGILCALGNLVVARIGRQDRDFDTIDDGDDSLAQWVQDFVRDAERAWRPFKKDTGFQRRLAFLKALLIAADAAGSALPPAQQPIEKWIRSALAERVDAAGLEPVVQVGHKGNPHHFQEAVAGTKKSATVVIAGCGNGKTTAAYMWGQTWAVGRKLFFTYPTTGTASAGFEDYLLEQKQVTSALIHGRALVDLEAMLGTEEDDKLDEWLRLESLQAWNRQVIVCTADTVLGLIQNQKRPLYSFPAIAAGAFVFDEIHSYDRRMFGELLTFLETFPGAPVLLMSASIPPHRLAELQRVLGERTGEVIRGDTALEGYKRYRLERRGTEEACWPEVEEALRRERKVLWVCNTVRSAIDLAGKARQKKLGVEPIIYHARFRYRDKVKRQKQVIDEFAYEEEQDKRHLRAHPRASLAITTQVCEMSLDLSADLMVTAECPLPSLVQRLGRLNRYASGNDPRPCLVYPFLGDPYNEEEKHLLTKGDCRAGMEATRRLLDELQGLPCSQADLAGRLDGMKDREEPDRSSAWLHGGWLSEPQPARVGDQSITIVREEDLREIEGELGREDRRFWTSKRLVPWTIPMLYDRRFAFTRRVGGYPLAPAGTVRYDQKEGATWQLS
jgi:CRISPR-associated endonuclease/helicase Cas3